MNNKLFKISLLLTVAAFTACGQTPDDSAAPESLESSDTSEVVTPETEVEAEAEKQFTMELYESIELGITYEAAVELIGGEGEVTTESGDGEFTTTIYKWENSDSSNISLMFQKDGLITKYQTNLVPRADVELTQEKYEQLEFGSDYASAVAVMGGDGVESSKTIGIFGQPERTEYQWGEDFEQQITVAFQEGSLVKRSQVDVITGEVASVSEEKYEAIVEGMNYEAIVELMGAEGIEQSKTVIPNLSTTSSYFWEKSNPFTRVSVVFQGGQPISKNYTGPE